MSDQLAARLACIADDMDSGVPLSTWAWPGLASPDRGPRLPGSASAGACTVSVSHWLWLSHMAGPSNIRYSIPRANAAPPRFSSVCTQEFSQFDPKTNSQDIDFCITLGGDGTVLYMVSLFEEVGKQRFPRRTLAYRYLDDAHHPQADS